MKPVTTLLASAALISTLTLGSGCIAIGNRDAQRPDATLGQQLIDLQKARDVGAINDAEYRIQKAKLLETK